MKTSTTQRFHQVRAVILLSLAAILSLPPTVQADDDGPDIIRVEEDWVLQISSPDPNIDAPQVVTIMSPSGDLEGSYAIFELNHMSLPSYSSGGMQLQIWNDEDLLDFRNYPNTNALTTDNESIRYTMSMSLANGQVNFEVINGDSTTWGKFGGQGYLKHNIVTSLTKLSAYRPATSVKYSQIGFAANQVQKFYLKEVRYYSVSGLVSTDTTERVVHVNSP